jgi:HSP20 family molecular chaperone IbpA
MWSKMGFYCTFEVAARLKKKMASLNLGKIIDPTKISANLADGVMAITAKKNPKLLQAQTVAITTNPHPTLLKDKDEEKKAE